MLTRNEDPRPRDHRNLLRWAATLAVTLVASVWVVRDHLAHATSALPYLLLLLCPVFHLVGHRHGHGPN